MLALLLAFIISSYGPGNPSRNILNGPGLDTSEWSRDPHNAGEKGEDGVWGISRKNNKTRVTRNAYFPSTPVYEKIFRNGMNCDFEEKESCVWDILPNNTTRKVII